MHECHQSEFFDMLKKELKEIKDDVKELVAERNRQRGIIVAVTAIATVVFSLIAKAFGR